MSYSVGIVVGSLRKDSFKRKIANTFIKVAPATLKPEIVEIGELTLFNQDIEAHPPASWVAFKSKIKAADAVLFVTPEYNRSMPGVLKNAIDVASRPYGQSAWEGKPAALRVHGVHSSNSQSEQRSESKRGRIDQMRDLRLATMWTVIMMIPLSASVGTAQPACPPEVASAKAMLTQTARSRGAETRKLWLVPHQTSSRPSARPTSKRPLFS